MRVELDLHQERVKVDKNVKNSITDFHRLLRKHEIAKERHDEAIKERENILEKLESMKNNITRLKRVMLKGVVAGVLSAILITSGTIVNVKSYKVNTAIKLDIPNKGNSYKKVITEINVDSNDIQRYVRVLNKIQKRYNINISLYILDGAGMVRTDMENYAKDAYYAVVGSDKESVVMVYFKSINHIETVIGSNIEQYRDEMFIDEVTNAMNKELDITRALDMDKLLELYSIYKPDNDRYILGYCLVLTGLAIIVLLMLKKEEYQTAKDVIKELSKEIEESTERVKDIEYIIKENRVERNSKHVNDIIQKYRDKVPNKIWVALKEEEFNETIQ